MALDLKGFSTPEQNFGGLYKLGDNLERNKQRTEMSQQRDAANKSMKAKFLENYLDPKEYLTGTIQDPYITERLSNILQKGSVLANEKGVDANMMQMALSTDVNKLTKEVQNIKEVERQRKESSDLLKGRKGIDPQKYNEHFKRSAYFNEDGTLKDLSDIDPTKNYADETFRNGEIYTPEGIDEFVKGSGKNTYSTKLKVQNGRGGFEDKSVSITSPSFMIPDKDGAGNHVGFVPEWEYATSEGKNVPHDFYDASTGKYQKADVRMVTKDVYGALPPEAKAYLRQEAIKYAKQHNVEPSSPEVDNFQRALAYDEIKRSEKQTSSFRQNEEKRENPIKIYTGGGGSKPTEKEKSRAESANYLHKTLDDTAPDENGNLDATELLAGINILSPLTKKPLKPEQSVYNPQTKVFTFTSDGVEEKIPFHKLYSLAATANSGIDKDWLKGFETYSRSDGAKNEPAKPKEKKVGFLGGLINMGKKALEATKQKSKTSVYKGLDKDGNPIFE